MENLPKNLLLALFLFLLAGCSKNDLIKGINIDFDKQLDVYVDAKIPVSVPVDKNLSIRISRQVPVNVPIRQTFDVPLNKNLDVKISKMIIVPIDQDINVNAVIPVDIIVPIDTVVTTTVSIPLVGNVNIDIPVRADVPVRINVPIQNQKVHVADNINFLFDDTVSASINTILQVPLDTSIMANAAIDDIFYVPIKVNVDSLIPISQRIPVRINQTLGIKKDEITLIK